MTSLAVYLSKLIRAQLYGEEVPVIPEDITVKQVAEISRKNHMDYLLLGALMKSDIPEEDKVPLRSRVLMSVSRTLTQMNELRIIKERFESEGIVNQPMKGAVMKTMYPSPEMREMSDIDILVPIEKMEQAAEIFKEMGYELYQSIKHHDIYVKKPYMVLESHWTMYDKTVDKAQHEYFSDMSKRMLREGCQYTYDFTKEDFYVYMMAHMAKHFYKMGCGIRNLVDIYVYNRKYGGELNREYVEKEMEACGILKFSKHMETLTELWMEGKEFPEFYANLFRYMVDSGIYGKDENGIWNKFAEENNTEKEISRFRLKSWYFFPPLAYMSEYYPWLEEKPYLLVWAWIIRAVGGIFKHKGVYKREMLNNISDEQINIYKDIYQEMELHFKQ